MTKPIPHYVPATPPPGRTPAIILIDPKYAHNVGAAVRAAACFGIPQVWFTGDRVRQELEAKRRLPREERMRAYDGVQLIHSHRPFDYFRAVIPVAVELTPTAGNLNQFIHPDTCVYVFGPEDGSIPKAILKLCHHQVKIPSFHCLNLGASIYVTLYDRAVTQYELMGEALPALRDTRGFFVDLEKE